MFYGKLKSTFRNHQETTLNTNINPPLRLLVAFQQSYPSQEPEWIVQAPGREMWVAANITSSDKFTIVAPDLDARTKFDRRAAKSRRTFTNRPLPRWARYPAGVIITLYAEGMDTPGMEAIVAGEEPPGPRYDYALGMAFAALWHQFNQRPYTTDSLIELVDRVQREYVER